MNWERIDNIFSQQEMQMWNEAMWYSACKLPALESSRCGFEIWIDLTDREFKIFVMKKLNELKETQRGSSENSGIESLN